MLNRIPTVLQELENRLPNRPTLTRTSEPHPDPNQKGLSFWLNAYTEVYVLKNKLGKVGKRDPKGSKMKRIHAMGYSLPVIISCRDPRDSPIFQYIQIK